MFSYNESQISASGTNYISFVRFQLDDTNSVVYDLSDEVIVALYGDTSSSDTQITRNYYTAVKAAEYLYAKYSKAPMSYTSAGTTVNRSDRLSAIEALIASLQMKLLAASNRSPIIYAYRPLGYCEV